MPVSKDIAKLIDESAMADVVKKALKSSSDDTAMKALNSLKRKSAEEGTLAAEEAIAKKGRKAAAKPSAAEEEAITPEVMPDDFEIPRPQKALPKGGDINRGSIEMGEPGVAEVGLSEAARAQARRDAMQGRMALPEGRSSATGEVIQMGEGGTKERGLERARYPGTQEEFNAEPPAGTPAATAAILGNAPASKSTAMEAGLEDMGLPEGRSTREAAKSGAKKLALAGVVGGTAYGGYQAWKGDDKKPVEGGVPSTPSVLTERGKAAYEAKSKTSELPDPYDVRNLMPTGISASKIDRKAPEAPDLTPEQGEMATALDKMRGEMNTIAAEYKLTKDEQARQRLWEGLVNGMAAIAAGVYGMKNGVDMGGVKFSPTDWAARAKDARDDMLAARMAAEKDYDLSKSMIEAKQKGKLDNWQINQKLYENAAREAAQRDEMSGKNAQLKMEGAKLNLQAQQLRDSVANNKAELMLKARELGMKSPEQKQALQTLDDFDKAIVSYNKDKDDLFLEQMKNLNNTYQKLTGSMIVPPKALEGGWFSNPAAADIEAARAAPQAAPVMMMAPDGRKIPVDPSKVEAAKARGLVPIQQ